MTAVANIWMWRKRAEASRAGLSLYIKKVPAGWRLDVGGRISHFGTAFLALHTATNAARAAAATGRQARVFVERPDGGWNTAWISDVPFAA